MTAFDVTRAYFYEPAPAATRPPDGAPTLVDTVRTLVLLDIVTLLRETGRE